MSRTPVTAWRGCHPELEGLHQYLLNDTVFAGIVMGVKTSSGNVMIRSQRFLANLTPWLIYHFKGKLKVVVQDRILFSMGADDVHGTVTLVVEEVCAEGDESCRDSDGVVEASVFSGSS